MTRHEGRTAPTAPPKRRATTAAGLAARGRSATGRRLSAVLGLGLGAIAAAGLSPAPARSAEAGPPARPSRVVLASGSPAAAPGWELSVRRVTFAPGVAIPGEIHPGMQVVYVVSGELTLRVLGGQAQARRALPDGSQGPVETFLPSERDLVFRAGDTVLEPETLVLAPRNAGSEPLVILASSLLPAGAPHAVYIEQDVSVD